MLTNKINNKTLGTGSKFVCDVEIYKNVNTKSEKKDKTKHKQNTKLIIIIIIIIEEKKKKKDKLHLGNKWPTFYHNPSEYTIADQQKVENMLQSYSTI